jgi:oligopeptide transport system substrate-binding protein
LNKKKLFLQVIISCMCIISTLNVNIKAETGKNVVIFNNGEESKTIDPQLVTGETGIRINVATMEGLVMLGKTPGDIIPGVAEKWKTSKDGLEWTFHIRKDAKWSNGEPVTSHDALFGIKRALAPNTAAEYAYLLYYIKNGKEYNTGKITDFNKVGIKAPDAYTLKITLEKPCAFFLQLMAFPTSYPLNEKFYNKIDGDNEYALEADMMLYNGSWKIAKWVHDSKFILKKNPYYWNKKNVKIDELRYLLIADNNTASNMFRNGQLDMTRIGSDQAPQFKGNKEMHYVNAGGIWYLIFNTDNKFLKNKKIRQAFGMAIDKKVLCDTILKNGSTPAEAFVPPETFGGKGTTFRKRFDSSLFKYDVAKAKQLLKEGLKEINWNGPIEIKLLLNASGMNKRCCLFIQQELFKNLGVNVELDTVTFQARLQKLTQRDYDFAFYGWNPDYNDPMTYLDLYVTDGGNNRTGYSNKEYDKLIEQANNTADNNIRMKAMAKAEKIIIDDMPIAPLYYSYRIWLIKSWIKDIVIRSAGYDVSFYWAYIDKAANSKKE